MLYLLDANVLITAKNLYYEFDRVPEYWKWLDYQSQIGNAKIPIEIYDEIMGGDDELKYWLQQRKNTFILDSEVDSSVVDRVVTVGYANDLSDVEIQSLRADPFLIAHALSDPLNRVVVTIEPRSNEKR